jgi:hypothetical protein
MLRSARPGVNFNGKSEAIKGYGYGLKKAVKWGENYLSGDDTGRKQISYRPT